LKLLKYQLYLVDNSYTNPIHTTYKPFNHKDIKDLNVLLNVPK